MDPSLLLSVPATLLGTPVDATDGENIVSVDFPKLKHQAVGPGYGKGPARSMLDHVYLNCANSSPSPGKRNWDEYGLPVPQLSTQETPGVAKTFDFADVWRCYVRNFAEWEEFEDRYASWNKIKQAVDVCQFWGRPPGSLTAAVRLDGRWSSKQHGRGREYVVLEKCWCMCTKPNNELNMGLWCCIKLDPEDENEQRPEPSAEDESPFASAGAKGKGKDVRATDANSIVPGE